MLRIMRIQDVQMSSRKKCTYIASNIKKWANIDSNTNLLNLAHPEQKSEKIEGEASVVTNVQM
jgi:hypothetical protein